MHLFFICKYTTVEALENNNLISENYVCQRDMLSPSFVCLHPSGLRLSTFSFKQIKKKGSGKKNHYQLRKEKFLTLSALIEMKQDDLSRLTSDTKSKVIILTNGPVLIFLSFP